MYNTVPLFEVVHKVVSCCLWCNGRIWPNVNYFFHHSLHCCPHTSSIGFAPLGFRLYRNSHPNPWNIPQLQMWPHHRSDTAPQPSVFFTLGNRNSEMVPNQENMEGDQPVQTHSHTQQVLQPHTCVQEHCPGETGIPSSVFQVVYEMPRVPLIQWGFIWKETRQLIAGNVDLMHGKFHCCGTTPPHSTYELFSPPSYVHWCMSQQLNPSWNAFILL